MSKVQINVNNNTDSVVQVTKSDDESNIFIHVNDPPKESKAKIAAETVVAGDGKTYDVTPLSEWQDGEVKFRKVGYVEKEWPAVGDEVLTKETNKATIIAIYERFAWIENFEGYLGMEIVAIEDLKKPPTPEDELKQFAVDIWNENNHDFGDFMDVFVNYIQNKPQ